MAAIPLVATSTTSLVLSNVPEPTAQIRVPCTERIREPVVKQNIKNLLTTTTETLPAPSVGGPGETRKNQP